MIGHQLGGAAWAFAAVGISSALVRLIVGVLAAHAARKALSPSAGAEVAAQRLAVLRVLMDGLGRRRRRPR
ncbi:hypothetical protein [Streptomyces sp. NBC_01465]|uniref:hypothetical protein n=1 Tax=Streptomyces sp. NBC_01465 TaxID=2903878 RepID=UPI002E33A96E|nr:hypothetical protein [Streptomyces sp. NBC_01465]